ncbi:MAG: ankyrin repeat domain-containing protein [Gemmatimonadetes bacterium]|nr:ankyrin repeat domain-containing protein [Gemmatimonadota bacterium]
MTLPLALAVVLAATGGAAGVITPAAAGEPRDVFAVATGDPPLVQAARNGDEATLRRLVEQGADVNAMGGDGSTALLWASHRDLPESVALLIAAGADVNRANDLGATPLWAAGENGSVAVAALLLDAAANPNLALRHGETPLMASARAGRERVAELLLEHGADPNATGPRDQTALIWAVLNRSPDVVKALLDHGADVHPRTVVTVELKAHEPHTHIQNQGWFEHGGNTALMFAARVGDVESARHLVAAGADVDDRSGFGVSALAMAAYSNFRTLVAEPAFSSGGPYTMGGREGFRPGRYRELIEFLLEAGADPDAGSDRFTALHAAILRHDQRSVDLLLEHGADVTLPIAAFTPHQRGSNQAFYFHNGWIGARPVWLAARFGTAGILRSLLAHGADPRFVHRSEYFAGSDGALTSGIFAARQLEFTTTLMAALGMSNAGRPWVYERVCTAEHEQATLEKVQLLVDAGADLAITTAEGFTVLDQARALKYESVVEILVAAGAPAGVGADDTEYDFLNRRTRGGCR